MNMTGTKAFRDIYNQIELQRHFSFLRRWIERSSIFTQHSYSFYGEDLLIHSIVSRIEYQVGLKVPLSYVDIGAWRPKRGSNTYKLYREGSAGTAVEPNEHLAYLWKTIRPRDHLKIIGCGLAPSAPYAVFEGNGAANTTNYEFRSRIVDLEKAPFSIKEVSLLRLDAILSSHLETFSMDYVLDVDAEGSDLEVVESFNFSSLKRPLLILIEDDSKRITQSRINEYLAKNSYDLVARSPLTSIYFDSIRLEMEFGNCLSKIQ